MSLPSLSPAIAPNRAEETPLSDKRAATDNAAPAEKQTGGFFATLGPALPGLTLFFAFLLATAWPMLRWWWWEYTKPESHYGFAVFVPALVALMLWHRRDALVAVPKKPAPAALFLVIPALTLLVIAIKGDMQAVMSWSFLLSLIGGLWFVLGGQFIKVAAFPLLFLWLMAPLPGPVLNDMTLRVQGLSTVGAAKLLGLIGLHPNHQGNLIHLENYTLNVDVPCSGFKLLLTLLTVSAAFAYLTDTTLARRWGLFLFSLPLAVFVNAVRIALIGIVGEAMGTSAAHVFHDYSGMISLVLCMAILFGTAKVLGCRTFAGQPIF